MRTLIAALVLMAAVAGCTTPPVEDPSPPLVERSSSFPLALPITCWPGESCWVINHVDLDPGPGRRDYRCGSMSFDGNKGTGIGLRNLASLDLGVAVRASAPGTIAATRDGMPDIGLTAGTDALRGRECGNGVRIEHADGWVTQYCHLKRGSIAVQVGQPVETGQHLGAVGLSGRTEFPHLAFSVTKDGEAIDPFRGLDGGPECGRGVAPLWDVEARKRLEDHAPILLDAGFATGPVERTDAESGTAGRTSAGTDADALAIWTRIAGIEPGDVLLTVITGPDGAKIFTDLWRATDTRIVQFRFVGKKRPDAGWPPGTYTGRAILKREGRRARGRTLTIVVEHR